MDTTYRLLCESFSLSKFLKIWNHLCQGELALSPERGLLWPVGAEETVLSFRFMNHFKFYAQDDTAARAITQRESFMFVAQWSPFN